MQFSANLGFLWADLPLPEAIRAAARAGFDAVECHWPYDTPAEAVMQALRDTKLPMLGLNTRRGRPGENGLSALPGREDEAHTAIDEAIDYGARIGAGAVHVMAGIADGEDAHRTFVENLHYACNRAAAAGMTVLIEPLNPGDAPGYFLNSAEQAASIIDEVAREPLRLMFDCYHLQIIHGEVSDRFERLLPLVGHVQIASVPGRAAPDSGDLDYNEFLFTIGKLGWNRPIGAEYKPGGPTDPTLGWLPEFKSIPVSG